MQTTTTTRRDAGHRMRSPLIRPDLWQPFYEMRARGLVPASSFGIRVTLSPGLVQAFAMEIPAEQDPMALDFSPCSGLDTFAIFDGERETYGRLRNAVAAILRSDPASLMLWDAPPNLEPRCVTLKRADFPRRWKDERPGAAHE